MIKIGNENSSYYAFVFAVLLIFFLMTLKIYCSFFDIKEASSLVSIEAINFYLILLCGILCCIFVFDTLIYLRPGRDES